MERIDSPAFAAGQKVAISRLFGPDAWVDRELQLHEGRTGIIIEVWCRTRDEMPELSKSFEYPDVWRYDVRMEEGIVVPGVPEAALSYCLNKNS